MSADIIPDFFEQADMDDPRQMFAPAITAWPPAEKMQPFPTIRVLVPYHSEFLYRLGYRHHPELQELFKVADGDGHKFVEKDEYEAMEKAEPQTQAEMNADRMRLMLNALNPKLAQEIDLMTEDERAARMSQVKGEVEESIRQLGELNELLNFEADKNDDSRRASNS